MKEITDPKEFEKITKLAFAPIYPYLAQCIKKKFEISEGICVDVGSGPGSLAIELARITNLLVYSVDIQEKMTEVAVRNIAEAGLSSRVRTVTADVCKMPFDDDSVDLVVSRGSLPFWEDRSAAFREIYRVLKPGGSAYVGGGFGSARIKSRVIEAFKTNEALKANRKKFLSHMKRPKFTPKQLLASLADASVVGTIKREYCGLWVQIDKPGRQTVQTLNVIASRPHLLRNAKNQ